MNYAADNGGDFEAVDNGYDDGEDANGENEMSDVDLNLGLGL